MFVKLIIRFNVTFADFFTQPNPHKIIKDNNIKVYLIAILKLAK